MGFALVLTVVFSLLGSGITFLWFRMANARNIDPELALILKMRRANFETSLRSAETRTPPNQASEAMEDFVA